MRILLIEDEKINRITLKNTLEKEHYSVTTCETGTDGLEAALENSYDVVITDLRLPGINGMEILKQVKEARPEVEVIVITAYASVETAVDAIKSGAYDYLTKPFGPDELLNMLSHIKTMKTVIEENSKLKKKIESYEKKTIIGQSGPIRHVIDTIHMIGDSDCSVLIQGESGTGKELVAKELHYSSNRKEYPFIAVNCAAIPASLLESLLFGHEKGAFSGADKKHIGYFERADKGTLFIDEVDDMPVELQVKLLRVIQERQFERVGGSRSIHIDIRLVCATKVDLQEKVAQNQFREDLYYRLNVVPVLLPPLRDRKEDIPLLVDHFLEKYNAPEFIKQKVEGFYSEMMDYTWPGNIRELENIIQRIIAIPAIKTLNLSQKESKRIEEHSAQDTYNNSDDFSINDDFSFQKHIESQEIEIIHKALDKASGKVSKAARLLGLPRSTLKSKMDKYSIKL